ncbi:putative membrane protein [Mycobacterium kansasii 824]|uniref:Putative membrane protein n=1 Tax=Mycobacterium kansasii TaxID=1768 RepID=A0A1V3WGN1_MYCKA|nr:putative membrane protein [Mycobacterium kansasii 824]OOK65586.1 putative membrane protein [Mycobacterium kansasii]
MLVALGWAIFGLVLAVVVIGVLYIARDFIAHHIGWHLLGAKRA